MKSPNFVLKVFDLWVLVLASALLLLFGAADKIRHEPYADNILMSGITFTFVVWGIILRDITGNNVHNKTFWILSMFILPGVAPPVYLLRRRSLLASHQVAGDSSAP